MKNPLDSGRDSVETPIAPLESLGRLIIEDEQKRMSMLSTLLIVYLSVVVFNTVFAAFCFFYYRDRINRSLLCLWLGTLATGLLQIVFQSNPLSMVLSFATAFVS